MTSRTTTTATSTSTSPTPSTIATGFTLSLPPLPNPATSDSAYTRILQWYLPGPVYDQLRPRLEQFGAEAVSDEVNDWVSNAEKQPPYVKSRNVWGEKYAADRLVTSDGWKKVGAWGVRNGCVGLNPSSLFLTCSCPGPTDAQPAASSPPATSPSSAPTAASPSTLSTTSIPPAAPSTPARSP